MHPVDRVTGIVQRCEDERGAGVLMMQFLKGVRLDTGIVVEAESAAVVIGLAPVMGLGQDVRDKDLQPFAMHGLGGAISDPMLVGEVTEILVDMGGLFHGELKQAKRPGLMRIVDHEREVTKAKEFVRELLNLASQQVVPPFFAGHVKGNDVSRT